jgi:hypothetical protein
VSNKIIAARAMDGQSRRRQTSATGLPQKCTPFETILDWKTFWLWL